jgi:hypothetical protein
MISRTPMKNHYLRCALFFASVVCWLRPMCDTRAGDVKWAGTGSYRVLVTVPPAKIGDRDRDEMVARCEFDIHRLLPDVPQGRLVDFETVQVIKHSAVTGEPEVYGGNHYGVSQYGRHFRFYDAGLLDEFPTWQRYASIEAKHGRTLFKTKPLPFGHRVFNPVGDGLHGTLVWAHTQQLDQPSEYGIYFDLLPKGREPLSPPAGFVGDGGNRIVRDSSQCGPPGNNSGCITDWNNDGLHDVVYGTSSGYLIVAENTGTKENPAFQRRRLLYDTTGKPIDVGYDSCPHVTDWNGDGRKDLLVGAEKGCILYYENRRTDRQPLLAFSGFLEVDRKMLETPNWPIAELAGKEPGEVYPQDYLAIPCAVDWDGDGDLDLLAGGFVTGMVFYYENVERQDDGTPLLRARGLLEADGKPIDTAWAAAPVAVDIDSDGDLDLICGAKPMTPKGGDVSDPEKNLYFYENTGSRRRPVLTQRAFPMNQLPPTGTTVMASVVDWNADETLDLVLVTRSMQLFFVRNIGSKTKPMFDMKARPVAGHWTNGQLSPGSWTDWNGDGHPDLISRFNVMLNSGKGMPGFFERRINLLRGSKPIRHPTPHGDENSSVICFDFDKDGDHDCIYGAHSGYIWLHENRGTNDAPDWDTEGNRLPLASGGVIKVGLPEGAKPKKFDFTVLQGARPKPAAGDFNGDGKTDLVIGDTFGKVRYFENAGSNSEPRFADPVMIVELRSRVNVISTKWNSDKHPDILVILGSRVSVLENKGINGRCAFKSAQDVRLPATIGGIYSVSTVDYNEDGDDDIIFHTSHRLTCFVESSFSRFGYRDAEIIRVERRKK